MDSLTEDSPDEAGLIRTAQDPPGLPHVHRVRKPHAAAGTYSTVLSLKTSRNTHRCADRPRRPWRPAATPETAAHGDQALYRARSPASFPAPQSEGAALAAEKPRRKRGIVRLGSCRARHVPVSSRHESTMWSSNRVHTILIYV